jgi:hypothetical protein
LPDDEADAWADASTVPKAAGSLVAAETVTLATAAVLVAAAWLTAAPAALVAVGLLLTAERRVVVACAVSPALIADRAAVLAGPAAHIDGDMGGAHTTNAEMFSDVTARACPRCIVSVEEAVLITWGNTQALEARFWEYLTQMGCG